MWKCCQRYFFWMDPLFFIVIDIIFTRHRWWPDWQARVPSVFAPRGGGGGISLWRWHTYSSYGCEGAFKATTTTITTRRFKKKKQQFCKHFCSLLCMTRTSNVLASRLVDLYTRNPFSFSFSELRYIPLGFNSRNILQHLTNWTNDMEY